MEVGWQILGDDGQHLKHMGASAPQNRKDFRPLEVKPLGSPKASGSDNQKLAQQMMAILTGGSDSRSSLSGASDDPSTKTTSTSAQDQDQEHDFVLPDPDLEPQEQVQQQSNPRLHSLAYSSTFTMSSSAGDSHPKSVLARLDHSVQTNKNGSPNPVTRRFSVPTQSSSDSTLASQLQAVLNGTVSTTRPNPAPVSKVESTGGIGRTESKSSATQESRASQNVDAASEQSSLSSGVTPNDTPAQTPVIPKMSFDYSVSAAQTRRWSQPQNSSLNDLQGLFQNAPVGSGSAKQQGPQSSIEGSHNLEARHKTLADQKVHKLAHAHSMTAKMYRHSSLETTDKDDSRSVFPTGGKNSNAQGSWGDIFMSAADAAKQELDFSDEEFDGLSAAQQAKLQTLGGLSQSVPNIFRDGSQGRHGSVFDDNVHTDRMFASFSTTPPRSPRAGGASSPRSKAAMSVGSGSESPSGGRSRPESPTVRGRGATDAIGLGIAMACSSFIQGRRSRLSGVTEPALEKVDVSNREAYMSMSARRTLEAIPKDAEISILILPDRAYFPSTSRRVDRGHNKITDVIEEKVSRRSSRGGERGRRYIVLFCESLEGWNSLTVGLCANFLPRDVVHDQFRQALSRRFTQISPPTVKAKKNSGEQYSKAAYFTVYQGVAGEKMYIFEENRDRSSSPASRSISPTRPLVHMGSTRGLRNSGSRETRITSSYD